MGLSTLQEPQNHVIFNLDASSSMRKHSEALIKLFNDQIKHLVEKSRETHQETRVSVYTFSDRGTSKCVLFDMDVLRVQEMFDLSTVYKPYGMTALCESVILSVEDLKLTPQKYGQHSFWLIVITDGQENDSSVRDQTRINSVLTNLDENWTGSIFVPDSRGRQDAVRHGFPNDNIAVWDAASSVGMKEAGSVIRQASESYFTMRSSGGRGTKSLFSLNTISTDTIKRKLTPIPRSHFVIDTWNYGPLSKETIQIRDFCEAYMGITVYVKGAAYYELKKREKIQASKAVIIEHNGQFYSGPDARRELGLPDYEVMVDPDYKAGYRIFVQSTSVNRNIIPGQRVLYITGNITKNFFR